MEKRMAGIVPKNKAPGVDFCALGETCYIIRSDMNCYLETNDLTVGTGIKIYSLHQSCQGGEHYLATDRYFYIIKGNNYRRVSNLSTDADAAVFTIHPTCRGGDHYFSVNEEFFVVFQSKGTFRKVADLHSGDDGEDDRLHPECRNGLYYWGQDPYSCFLKPSDEWGVQYFGCIALESAALGESFSLHDDIINFLPGGLSITLGPAYGMWECIKTISNDSAAPIIWEKKITTQVGFAKEKMASIEHNWNLSLSASYGGGALTAAFARFQISLTAEYGGASVNTETENWNEATTVEESVNLTLDPGQRMYVWQYRLGLGNQDVLFCRDMKFDDDPSPPKEIPLPSSDGKRRNYF